MNVYDDFVDQPSSRYRNKMIKRISNVVIYLSLAFNYIICDQGQKQLHAFLSDDIPLSYGAKSQVMQLQLQFNRKLHSTPERVLKQNSRKTTSNSNAFNNTAS